MLTCPRKKDLIEKKVIKPLDKREVLQYPVSEHSLSVQKSCKCIRLSRAACYSIHMTIDRDAAVIAAINAVIEKHARWGFWKCFKGAEVEKLSMES
jgi:putative transposase